MYQHKEDIKEQIRKRKYKPSPVRRVYIPKDNGDKRGLGIPTVVDRLIQQAIVQVMSPIYEEQFSETSYGFRPKRSCEMAIIVNVNTKMYKKGNLFMYKKRNEIVHLI